MMGRPTDEARARQILALRASGTADAGICAALEITYARLEALAFVMAEIETREGRRVAAQPARALPPLCRTALSLMARGMPEPKAREAAEVHRRRVHAPTMTAGT
jgi:hypothetical protein